MEATANSATRFSDLHELQQTRFTQSFRIITPQYMLIRKTMSSECRFGPISTSDATLRQSYSNYRAELISRLVKCFRNVSQVPLASELDLQNTLNLKVGILEAHELFQTSFAQEPATRAC